MMPAKRFMRRSAICAISLALTSTAAFAQVNLAGEWAGRYHEDQLDRVPGDVLGDHTGLPINDAARRYAEAWDVSRNLFATGEADITDDPKAVKLALDNLGKAVAMPLPKGRRS